MSRRKAIVMPMSRDPQSQDLPTSSILRYNSVIPSYWINTSFLEERSPTCLNEPLQIKQKCLNTSLEDYLQINAFPASSSEAREEVPSSMNESYWEQEVKCQEKSLL